MLLSFILLSYSWNLPKIDNQLPRPITESILSPLEGSKMPKKGQLNATWGIRKWDALKSPVETQKKKKKSKTIIIL